MQSSKNLFVEKNKIAPTPELPYNSNLPKIPLPVLFRLFTKHAFDCKA